MLLLVLLLMILLMILFLLKVINENLRLLDNKWAKIGIKLDFYVIKLQLWTPGMLRAVVIVVIVGGGDFVDDFVVVVSNE